MVAELPAPALELAAAVAGVVGVVLATIVDLVVVATLEIYNKNWQTIQNYEIKDNNSSKKHKSKSRRDGNSSNGSSSTRSTKNIYCAKK